QSEDLRAAIGEEDRVLHAIVVQIADYTLAPFGVGVGCCGHGNARRRKLAARVDEHANTLLRVERDQTVIPVMLEIDDADRTAKCCRNGAERRFCRIDESNGHSRGVGLFWLYLR